MAESFRTRANGEWQAGDQVTYMTGEKLTVYPGLYFYSGLGSGVLFLPYGKVNSNCSPSEAYAACEEASVAYTYRDSFDGYRSTYLGD